jgi:hypothetical protein
MACPRPWRKGHAAETKRTAAGALHFIMPTVIGLCVYARGLAACRPNLTGFDEVGRPLSTVLVIHVSHL